MELAQSTPDLSGAGAVSMRFHHVGVAVKSIERALAYYTDVFGFKRLTSPIEVAAENVRVCFIQAPPGVLIELVEGISEDSPVKSLAEKVGGGTYHMCYEVDDLDQTINILRRHKCFPFRRFEMSEHGRFAFLLTPDRQLFELCEPERSLKRTQQTDQ